MHTLLQTPAPWYVAGPLVGLIVVGMMLAMNARVGVLGGVADIVATLRGGSLAIGYRGTFVVGIALGGTLFALVHGGFGGPHGYGWLSRQLTGPAAPLIGVVLVGAGAAIGFGARAAGGCTSGNGICGVALGSRASLVATCTFMATAIGASLLLRAAFGS